MGDIKSSWEIASEKVAKLGKLSVEEQKQQKENELRPVANLVADTYLSSNNSVRAQNELNKYKSEDRELIKKIALKQLIERIDLHNSSLLSKVKAGIVDLAVDKKTAEVLNKIEELFNEYLEMDKANRQEIEEEGRELLHQLRISGSAITRVNNRAQEKWCHKLDTGAVPYQKDVDALKQKLLKLQ